MLFTDVPEALENSVEIARRCNLELKLGKSVLPAYPVPAGHDDRGVSARGIRARSRGAPGQLLAAPAGRRSPTTSIGRACRSNWTSSARWASPDTS